VKNNVWKKEGKTKLMERVKKEEKYLEKRKMKKKKY
jgi:hypothetical protein